MTELETTRIEFHALLDSLSDDDWKRPSRNPSWTNGQLMFHMALGFMIIPVLFSFIRIMSKLPRKFSKGFAMALNYATPLFNLANTIPPHVGGMIYNRESLGRKFDDACSAIIAKINTLNMTEWKLGMHYPKKWDPRFKKYMTFEDLFRYPIGHFRHHSRQIIR